MAAVGMINERWPRPPAEGQGVGEGECRPEHGEERQRCAPSCASLSGCAMIVVCKKRKNVKKSRFKFFCFTFSIKFYCWNVFRNGDRKCKEWVGSGAAAALRGLPTNKIRYEEEFEFADVDSRKSLMSPYLLPLVGSSWPKCPQIPRSFLEVGGIEPFWPKCGDCPANDQ